MLSQLLVACDNSNDVKTQHKISLDEINTSAGIFSERTLASTQAASHHIDLLNKSIALFLSEPTEDNRLALGESWKKSHGTMIISGTQPSADDLPANRSSSLLYHIDAWPIQPGYVDSIDGYPSSGIVNDSTVSLSAESLALQHGFSDTEEIIFGFHPLEYLIFAKTALDYQQQEHQQTSIQAIDVTQQMVYEDPSEDPIYRRRTLLRLLGNELKDSVSTYLATRLEQVPYAPSVSENQQQAARTAITLIDVAHSHATRGFEESHLLLDSDQSHSMYSQTTHLDVSQRLGSLSSMLNEPIWLSSSLRRVDKRIEQDLQTTLAQGIMIVEKGQFSESDRARLVTVFSALRHQLADLRIKLGGDDY